LKTFYVNLEVSFINSHQVKTFNELTTQSNTALSFGILLIVFSGRNTLSTLNDFIVLKFFPVAPDVPLKILKSKNIFC